MVGLRFRCLVVVTAALIAITTATECNATGSDSASMSMDASHGSEDGTDEAGMVDDDMLFGTLDTGKGNGKDHCEKRMRGCVEDARWCESLKQVQSRDPKICCKFPDCPE